MEEPGRPVARPYPQSARIPKSRESTIPKPGRWIRAQKVNIVLVDDIDGSEATQTVSFALDGSSYEIDLSDAHANELREALATYVAHGRKVSGGRRGRSTSTASKTAIGASAREIRDWARSNGYDVPDRGRIPADVRSAFEAAS